MMRALMAALLLAAAAAPPRVDASWVLDSEIPMRAKAAQPESVLEAAVVVRRGDQVLLLQRPAKGRWASLWEFPHGAVTPNEAPDAAAARLLPELTGIQADIGTELVTLHHGVTRFRITLVCFEAKHLSGQFHSAFYQNAVWLTPRELSGYPVSSPQRRLAQVLSDPDRQRRLF